VADGCSRDRNEGRQTVFTDLTFLMLRVAAGQCRELRDRIVLCISPFILRAPGGGEGRRATAGTAVLRRGEDCARIASAEDTPHCIWETAVCSCKRAMHRAQSC